MCGLIGYIGIDDALPIILDRLQLLEYRGYDSCGIAITTKNNAIVRKTVGTVSNLRNQLNAEPIGEGYRCGIGHTRWASYGKVSFENAHPHISCNGSIIGVHNGTLDNAEELKEMLLSLGYKFVSQTDSEVILNLIEWFYSQTNQEPIIALLSAIKLLKGTYALIIYFHDFPDTLWITKKESPLIIGRDVSETFIASDMVAIKTSNTMRYISIDDLEVGMISKDRLIIYNENGEPKQKQVKTAIQSAEDITNKDGYKWFMLKEINEQPKILQRVLETYIDNHKRICLGYDELELKKIKQITIVGCGSSYFVGLIAKKIIEQLCAIPTRVEVASEINDNGIFFSADDLFIAVSQSGETLDTVKALKIAKANGQKTLALINKENSLLEQIADKTIHVMAGIEIAVATTKAFSAQLICFYLFALSMAMIKKTISKEEYDLYLTELWSLGDKIKEVITQSKQIEDIANHFINNFNMMIVGKGMDYPCALEGSLKLKEVSYIHAEAFMAGELKHGPICLVDKDMCLIGIATDTSVLKKMVNNLKEAQLRGARILTITNGEDAYIKTLSEYSIIVPKTAPLFVNSISVIVFQLLAYYIGNNKKNCIDKPRNLAKSVTVD